MKTRRLHLLPCFHLALICACPAQPATVNVCDEASLRAALAGGGTVTFACDGTITLASTIEITRDTVLDASGHQVTLDGGHAVRILRLGRIGNTTFPLVRVTLMNLTIANGSNTVGGGIENYCNLTVENCSLIGNQALAGGAIGNADGASFIGRSSLFLTNRAGNGGAISCVRSLVHVVNCTFVGNEASLDGAAIYRGLTFSGLLSGVFGANCTFSGNVGPTILYNSLPPTSYTFTLNSCIIANNTGTNCYQIQDSGYNICSDNSLSVSRPTTLVNTDPRLMLLASNGGPTLTLALLPDSPAIDGGDPASNLTTDQRGENRPVGNAPDIGAFETTLSGTHAGVLQVRPSPSYSYFANENDSNAVVTVHRAGTARGSASVTLSTSNGTAIAGADYVATTVEVPFADGEHTKEVLIPLVDDNLFENDSPGGGSESFDVHLTNPAGSSLGISRSSVFIVDDESRLGFSASNYFTSEIGGAATITVYRYGRAVKSASVHYSTVPGSALAGMDFEAVNGVLTFASNQYEATFSVPILDDVFPEDIEMLTVTLFDPTEAELGSLTTADVTIFDNERLTIVTNCNETSLREAMGSSHVEFACDGTITLSDTINIYTNVTLDASGHNVILKGNGTARVFEVMPGATLTLVNLTIANGVSTNGSGGGIYNDGTLILVGCTIATNLAVGGRGVDGNTGTDGGTSFPGGHGGNGSSGEPAFGGGIYNRGVLLSTNTSFTGNRAVGGSGGAGGAGGLGGRMVDQFARCLFGLPGGDAGLAGYGGYGMGGGICNVGEMVLVHATFQENEAEGGQGGLGGLAGAGGCGAARGAPTAGGQGGPGYGGAWFSNGRMTIIDSTAWANQALGGRGGNSADDAGFPPTPGPGGNGGFAQGGAGFNADSSTLEQVTLANNCAKGGQSGLGGRFNGFCPAKGGNGGDAQGGGLYCVDRMSVQNATIWNNVATGGVATNDFSGCPGVIPERLGTNGSANGSSIVVSNSISLHNTVVGGINVTQCCVGFVLDLGNNLCSDNSASFTDPSSRNNIDPLLGPLANNGGPTLTMSPLPGSPAIDAADTSSSPATDQRGVPRPQGAYADIGAVEGTFLHIERLSTGDMRLRYAGIPGESYTLETTPQFGELWSPIETKQANQNGTIQYSDLPGSVPHRFFRVESP